MKTSKRIRSAATFLTASLMLTSIAGCKVFSEKASAAPGPRYPDSMTKSDILDVQVFRDSTTLRFTNTTTNDFGPSTVWINQRYSSPLSSLASGQTVEMNLRIFVDEFGETFRAGGFFSQRVPAPVVLCQIETTLDDQTQLVGLVVVENHMD